MGPRILVIDDDAGVRSLLQRGLSYEGFLVETAPDGEAGLAAVRDRPPELVILDVMLPGLDGLEVLSRLRRVDANLPVVMLTARDRPDEQVRGLEGGADDYVTKPFSFDVLAARVRAQLRRRETDAPAVLRFGNLTLDPAGHSVTRDGCEITLTAQ